MEAAGETALYDAILEGTKMVDEAPGDPDAIRGVVVLTDGKANRLRRPVPCKAGVVSER
ncbi:MAG: hypothetical protein HYY05_00970 [Chloroflexi bacterium]|nr:hypothetical protein [Chloroflexota bacterium]